MEIMIIEFTIYVYMQQRRFESGKFAQFKNIYYNKTEKMKDSYV